MSLRRILVLAILVIATATQPAFLTGAAFFVLGPELGLSAAGLGVLTAVFFVTASISSVLVGGWVQRNGWQRGMRLNALTAGLGSIGIAVFGQSLPVFVALLVVTAAAYGLANPSANQALAAHVPPDRRATIFGIKHAGIPSATLIAGLAVPILVVSFGWRSAFLAAGIAALGVAVAIPRGEVHVPTFEGRDRRSEAPPLARRDLVWLAAGVSVATWAALSLGAFGVSASIDVGISEQAAGWVQAAGSGASIVMRIGAGWFTDRVHGRGFAGVISLMVVGAAVFTGLSGALPPAFAVLLVAAYATGWGWPGLFTFAVVNANPSSAAKSTAITQAGILLGSGIGPLMLGLVAGSRGFSAIWPIVALSLAVASAMVAIVVRHASLGNRRSLGPSTI